MLEPCLKHSSQHQYGIVLTEFRKLSCASKLHDVVWQAIFGFFKEGMHQAWNCYMESACTCTSEASTIRAPSTFRLGASWASANDVANLADLEDFPDDFGQHFWPSRG